MQPSQSVAGKASYKLHLYVDHAYLGGSALPVGSSEE